MIKAVTAKTSSAAANARLRGVANMKSAFCACHQGGWKVQNAPADIAAGFPQPLDSPRATPRCGFIRELRWSFTGAL